MSDDQDIHDLLREGKTVDAIRIYRERYKVGLREAKTAIDAMLSTGQADWGRESNPADVEGDIVRAIQDKGMIEAIKICRQRKGLRLKEAKDEVERLAARYKIVPKEKDLPCFIATAAYGDANAWEVVLLRRWREERLRPTWAGRAFIRLYSILSPPLARWVGRHPRRRSIVQRTLRRMLSWLLFP